jgi:glycosyltransferase involved in cell wall biosynthesis
MKQICWVTSGHISSNPRLVKEAQTFDQLGYQVNIVSFRTLARIAAHDAELLVAHPNWRFWSADWFAYSKWQKLPWVLRQKAAVRLHTWRPSANTAAEALSPSVPLLRKVIGQIPADLYMAHNLPALPAAAYWAKKRQRPLVFDIEDAYSFTHSYSENDRNALEADVEKSYFPQADLLTAASPFFAPLYEKHDGFTQPIHTILNVFPKKNIGQIEYRDRQHLDRLSLYWSSQTIGLNRGLQAVLAALKQLNRLDIELHLRGSHTEAVKKTLLQIAEGSIAAERIYFHSQVSSVELPFRTAEHDVGLALETSALLNRDLCLTNKIFEYMTAGMAIIATQTSAQQWLMQSHPRAGLLFREGDTDALARHIATLADDRALLLAYKQAAAEAGSTVCSWENQQKMLVNLVEKIL